MYSKILEIGFNDDKNYATKKQEDYQKLIYNIPKPKIKCIKFDEKVKNGFHDTQFGKFLAHMFLSLINLALDPEATKNTKLLYVYMNFLELQGFYKEDGCKFIRTSAIQTLEGHVNELIDNPTTSEEISNTITQNLFAFRELTSEKVGEKCTENGKYFGSDWSDLNRMVVMALINNIVAKSEELDYLSTEEGKELNEVVIDYFGNMLKEQDYEHIFINVLDEVKAGENPRLQDEEKKV